MTYFPAFARTIGILIVSVLISGCVASPPPVAYAPGAPVAYEGVSDYAAPSYAPAPYYGSPVEYYRYPPAYAYDPFPYGRTTFGIGIIGGRYYDDDRHHHRGKNRRYKGKGKGYHRGRHKEGHRRGRHKEGAPHEGGKHHKTRNRKGHGGKGHSKRHGHESKRPGKSAKADRKVVAATVTTGRDRPMVPHLQRRERGSQR